MPTHAAAAAAAPPLLLATGVATAAAQLLAVAAAVANAAAAAAAAAAADATATRNLPSQAMLLLLLPRPCVSHNKDRCLRTRRMYSCRTSCRTSYSVLCDNCKQHHSLKTRASGQLPTRNPNYRCLLE